MPPVLFGKLALITGAGSGIGKATARVFAREGAKVIAVDRNIEGAKETVKEIGSGKWDFEVFPD